MKGDIDYKATLVLRDSGKSKKILKTWRIKFKAQPDPEALMRDIAHVIRTVGPAYAKSIGKERDAVIIRIIDVKRK